MTLRSEHVLSLKGVRKAFGANQVLRGIDLDVQQGEVLAVIGPSGKGKSTLLKCIDLLEIPEEGQVIFMGKDYVPSARKRGIQLHANPDLRYLRTHIGIVFQQFNLFPHRTVVQNVMMAPILVLGMKPAEARERSAAQLERMGLQDKMEAYPSTLSGGQQQRVAIARALVMEPQLMLFDEVTSALDPELVGEVVNEIQRLAEGGMTMMVVTHHMGFARHSGTRLVFIDEGVIVEEGDPKVMLEDPQEARTREFLRRLLI